MCASDLQSGRGGKGKVRPLGRGMGFMAGMGRRAAGTLPPLLLSFALSDSQKRREGLHGVYHGRTPRVLSLTLRRKGRACREKWGGGGDGLAA